MQNRTFGIVSFMSTLSIGSHCQILNVVCLDLNLLRCVPNMHFCERMHVLTSTAIKVCNGTKVYSLV